MNGYFNNLAIRTVSHGNLVQPRLASVFEPQGVIESTIETIAKPLAARDHMDPGKPVSATPVRNTVAATERSVPAREFSSVPENMLASVTDFSFEPVVSQEESTFPVFESAPQHSEPKNRVSAPAPVNEVLVREEPPTVELPQIATAAIARTGQAKTATTNTTVQQPQRLELEAEDSFHAPQTEQFVSPLIKSVIHETETERSTRHFTERLTQQTKQIKESKQFTQATTRREQLLLESAPDPEPSINITIGRVEVRATPTAAPKQKSTRTASPVMPLEEYLRKQRRGDER